MAANVALKAYTILPRLAEVVAIELAFAYQAAAIRKYAPVIPSRAPKDNATRAGEIMEWVPIKEPAKRNLNEVGEIAPPLDAGPLRAAWLWLKQTT